MIFSRCESQSRFQNVRPSYLITQNRLFFRLPTKNSRSLFLLNYTSFISNVSIEHNTPSTLDCEKGPKYRAPSKLDCRQYRQVIKDALSSNCKKKSEFTRKI